MLPIDYLVGAMLAFVPLDKCPSEYASTDFYEGIAADTLVAASTDPIYSEADGGEVRTALLMLAIASYESHFDDDAVSVTHDVCLMQVRLREGESITDRQECLSLALDRIHETYKACHRRDNDWLSVYTTGKCYNRQMDARVRLLRADNWWNKHPFELETPEEDGFSCSGMCSADAQSVCV